LDETNQGIVAGCALLQLCFALLAFALQSTYLAQDILLHFFLMKRQQEDKAWQKTSQKGMK